MHNKRFLTILLIVCFLLAALAGCTSSGVTVSYDSMGGSKVASRSISTATTELELPIPTKDGYNFNGWYYDSSYSKGVDKKIIPTESITLYAKWSIIQIIITFYAEGSANQYAYVDYGGSLTVENMPTVPTKEGYTGRWLTTDLTNLTVNTTITAEYTVEDISVVYYVSDQDVDTGYSYLNVGGVISSGYKIYNYNIGKPKASITAPSINPIKSGFYFLGWYYDKEFTDKCVNLPDSIPDANVGNVVLYAHFMDVSNMSKYVTYVADGDNLKIVGLTAQGKNQDTIVIPSTIDGKTVTSIGYDSEGSNSESTLKVFASSYLTSLTIPETVTSIGCFALSGCTKLKTLTVDGNNLHTIGTGAFAGCSSLAEVYISDSITTIGSYAFAGITTTVNGNGKVVFSNGEGAWSSLNDWYYSDMSLSSFNIGKSSSLSNLKSFAFLNCDKLTTVSLPNSITEVNYAMFNGSSLSYIEIYEGNSDLINIGDAIYSSDSTTLYYYPVNGDAVYTLSAATTRISANAFRNNNTLTTLTLNVNLTSIGNYAFYNAVKLVTISCASTCALNSIGSYAFDGCKDLTRVDFPTYINTLGESAFRNCLSLEAITFAGNSLGAIPKYAFYGCAVLDNVVIPSNVKSIGEYAFYNCSSLIELNMNEDTSIMTSIGQYAFSECTSLIPFILPYTIEIIGKYAFASVNKTMGVSVDLYNTALITLGDYAFLNSSGMSIARLPSTITSLGVGVFKNCINLTSAKLESAVSLTTVPDYLFYNCAKISNTIILPINFTSIGDYAFYGCTSLTVITFKKDDINNIGITEIGISAFENCTKLIEGTTDEQYILPKYLDTLGEKAFKNCSSLDSIHIPNTLLVLSKEAFANCTMLSAISYDSGYILTTLSENCFANCSSLTSFEIPSTLTSRYVTVGSDTVESGFIKNPFYGCTSLLSFVSNIANVNNLIVIGGIVFEKTIVFETIQMYSIYAYPTGLSNIYEVASNVTAIDDYAFYGSSILELSFAQSTPSETTENITMVSIGDYAFSYSKVLTDVSISKRIYEIGKYAFYNCKTLSSVSIEETYAENGAETATAGITYVVTDGIENNLLTLNDYCFANIAITSLTIVPRIINIKEGSLSNCYSLLSVTFTDSFNTNLLTIGDYAFYADNGLTSLVLPVQLQYIGNYAFSYCVNVRDITFTTSESANGGSGVVLNVGDYAFSDCHFLYTLNLPSSLNSLGEGVFSYGSRLKYINFASTLKQVSLAISDKAFLGDTSIEQIIIPGYISSIGDYAFYELSLDKVTFAAGTVDLTICDYSFANLNKLTEITLPDRLVSLGNHTFENSAISSLVFTSTGNAFTVGDYTFSNIKITSFIVYARITSIGSYSFSNNTLLTDVDYIGHTAINISDYTYYNSKLQSISFDIIPDSIAIGSHAFDNTLSLTSFVTDSSAYILEASTVTIGSYAFYKSAVTTMSIKATNVTINDYAFNSTLLTSFVINETSNILKIGKLAIANNAKLATLSLNATTSITNLGVGFASYNTKLQSITLTDPTSAYTSLNGIIYNGTTLLLYPAGKIGATYQASDTTIAIADYAFAGNTLLCNLILDSGETIITKESFSFDKTASSLTFFTPSELVSAYINSWAMTNINYISTNLNGMVLKLLISGRYSLEKYTGLSTDITINSTIVDGEKTYKVVNIADKAFNNNISITSITLGDGIEIIGKYAFANCTNLVTVTFGKVTLTIDINAFQNCTKLTTLIFPKDGVSGEIISALRYINKYAFDGCYLLDNVILPDSLEILGQYAFNNCAGLKVIDLGDGIKTIENNCFAKCNNLVSISIPASVNEIDSYVFANCSKLSFVYMNSVTLPILEKNGFAQTLNGLRILVPQNLKTDFLSATNWRDYSNKVLPLEYICTDVGFENYIIENISGNQYRLVGYLGMESTVTLAYNLGTKYIVEIGSYSFNHFATSIILSEGIKTIGDYAFVNANNLTSVSIASTVTEIGDYAFYGITSLSNVEIVEWVNAKLVVPALTNIGSYAFYNTSITSMVIPALVSNIGSYAFSALNTATLNKITFEMSSTGFLTIGSYAFMNNSGLITITFNGFVDRIDVGAFNNCTALRSIYFNSLGVNPIDNSSTKTPSESILLNCNNLSIFVKQQSVMASFMRDWQNNSDKNKVLLSENVVQDTSNSVIHDYSTGSRVDIDTYNYFVVEIINSSTVSIKNYIGEYTGRYISGDNPQAGDPVDTDIVIPSQMIIGGTPYTVVAISSYAFNNKITSVTIPNTITAISSYAFANASSLESVTFIGQSRLSSISSYAFSECTNLTAFTVPKSVTLISDFAFNNCINLGTVTFEELASSDVLTTLTLNNYVFTNCSSLTSVTIPNHAIYMGNRIFSGATNLTNVLFNETLSKMKTIGTHSFQNTAISSIAFPQSLEGLGDYSFDSCANLTSVYLTRYSTGRTNTGVNVFSNINNPFIRVYVPFTSYDSYAALAGWNSKSVLADQKDDSNQFNYILNSNNALVTATITNYLGTSLTLAIPSQIIIGGNPYRVTSINSYAGNNKITKVTFEETSYLTTLADYAFANCISLREIHLPNTVTLIGESAFYGCIKLTDIVLPTGIDIIKNRVFYNCISLKEITLPANITQINEAAFGMCSSLNRIIIETTTLPVKSLGNGAFTGVGSTFAIIVPTEMKSIFKTEWSNYASVIYARDAMYGDYIIEKNIENEINVVQYNGCLDTESITANTIYDSVIRFAEEEKLRDGANNLSLEHILWGFIKLIYDEDSINEELLSVKDLEDLNNISALLLSLNLNTIEDANALHNIIMNKDTTIAEYISVQKIMYLAYAKAFDIGENKMYACDILKLIMDTPTALIKSILE